MPASLAVNYRAGQKMLFVHNFLVDLYAKKIKYRADDYCHTHSRDTFANSAPSIINPNG